MINWFSRFNIGADHIELHRVFFIRFKIKRVVFERNFTVTKIRAVYIPRFKQRTHAAIAFIGAKPSIVPQYPSYLMRFYVTAERRARGNADCAVERHAVFHQNVKHSRSKKSAHRAAFKNKSLFHNIVSFFQYWIQYSIILCHFNRKNRKTRSLSFPRVFLFLVKYISICSCRTLRCPRLI